MHADIRVSAKLPGCFYSQTAGDISSSHFHKFKNRVKNLYLLLYSVYRNLYISNSAKVALFSSWNAAETLNKSNRPLYHTVLHGCLMLIDVKLKCLVPKLILWCIHPGFFWLQHVTPTIVWLFSKHLLYLWSDSLFLWCFNPVLSAFPEIVHI